MPEYCPVRNALSSGSRENKHFGMGFTPFVALKKVLRHSGVKVTEFLGLGS
jgi:hypothetical protein